MSVTVCQGLELSGAWLAPNFCVSELPVSIERPRGILSTGTSSLLALERGTSSVVLLSDSTGSYGLADTKTVVVDGSAYGLNHGLDVHGGFLYASSSDAVYRWPYDSDNQVVVNDQQPELVITNINDNGRGDSSGGHSTRTLIFDAQDRLYVSVGSIANIDPDSFRSRIRRFVLNDNNNNTFPIDFTKGEVFMDGLRNEVGLAFDKYGILWGVENGPDRLARDDLGGQDIYNDNPGEELHRFPEEDAGKHYGYPYCWEEFDLGGAGNGTGTAWAWPSFLSDGTVTDQMCRTNYLSSELSMQAHSAPLGMTFYSWKDPSELPEECTGGAFPQEFDGYAFIAFHGSWNREIPTGYKVVYVAMDEFGRAVGSAQDLLMHTPPNAKWDDGFRPVDVDFDACGRLLVSSDGTKGAGAKMVRIESTAAPTTTPAPTSSPVTVESTDSPVSIATSTGGNGTNEREVPEPSAVPTDAPLVGSLDAPPNTLSSNSSAETSAANNRVRFMRDFFALAAIILFVSVGM